MPKTPNASHGGASGVANRTYRLGIDGQAGGRASGNAPGRELFEVDLPTAVLVHRHHGLPQALLAQLDAHLLAELLHLLSARRPAPHAEPSGANQQASQPTTKQTLSGT